MLWNEGVRKYNFRITVFYMSDTMQNTLYYPPDRDLSSGQCYPPIERWGSRLHLSFSAVRKPSRGIKQQLEFYKQPSDRTSYLTSA